ncbi:MAG TPA: MOFRL family protein, partial [Chloroflexota bacterium]|nr:MOFRL family protein [Chloroflexota bacterium]
YFSAVNCGRILRLIHPARAVNLIMQVGVFPRWGGHLPEFGMWVPSWPPAQQRMAAAREELKAQPWYREFTPALRALLESADPRYDVPDREDFRRTRLSFWQPIDPLQMVEGARATAERRGLKGVTVCAELHAQSAAAASVLANLAREVETYGRPFAPPVALVTGGHLDVPVGDATGVGGRNQEFTLLWARDLGAGRLASQNVIVAALDSDGTDGPGTQHAGGAGEFLCMAGGLVDGSTAALARERGVDLSAELANHNSTVALMKLNSAIYTGNTGACLGDLRVTIVKGTT